MISQIVMITGAGAGRDDAESERGNNILACGIAGVNFFMVLISCKIWQKIYAQIRIVSQF